MINLIKLIFISSILLNASETSLDKNIYESNIYYYEQLKNISIIKDKAKVQFNRELAFKNLVCCVDGSAWVTLNKGLIEILTIDSSFLFEQFNTNIVMYQKWFKYFNFNWLDTTQKSTYPELKTLAIIALEADIEKSQKLLKMKKEFLNKIKETKPTMLD